MSRRDKAKLATMSEDRYPKQLFCQEWNVKSRRSRGDSVARSG